MRHLFGIVLGNTRLQIACHARVMAIWEFQAMQDVDIFHTISLGPYALLRNYDAAASAFCNLRLGLPSRSSQSVGWWAILESNQA
jgi:hypothetical protein